MPNSSKSKVSKQVNKKTVPKKKKGGILIPYMSIKDRIVNVNDNFILNEAAKAIAKWPPEKVNTKTIRMPIRYNIQYPIHQYPMHQYPIHQYLLPYQYLPYQYLHHQFNNRIAPSIVIRGGSKKKTIKKGKK